MKEDQLYLAAAQSADDVVVESRQHAAGNFVEGRVCEKCNNTWMSALETEAMAILKPLIDGTASLLSISNTERAIVAKWGTKTSYVISHATPLKKTPDPSHLHYMKEHAGDIPPRVGVFAQQSMATAGFRQIQRNQWRHLAKTPPMTPLPPPPPGSYKIALQFRHLMLLVAHWSAPDIELMIAAGIHIPLWPQRLNVAYHAQMPSLNMNDAMAPLDRFCTTLAVCDSDFSAAAAFA